MFIAVVGGALVIGGGAIAAHDDHSDYSDYHRNHSQYSDAYLVNEIKAKEEQLAKRKAELESALEWQAEKEEEIDELCQEHGVFTITELSEVEGAVDMLVAEINNELKEDKRELASIDEAIRLINEYKSRIK